MFPFGKVIIICWLVFWLYWFASAIGTKKNVQSKTNQFFGIRVGFLIVIIVLLRFLNVNNYSLQNHLNHNNQPILVFGLVIFFLGLLLTIWARLHLGKNWGTPMAQKVDPELVTSGPYRYVRHPIYSGILLAMLGSAIAGNVFWLIIFAFCCAYCTYSAFQEEKLMTKEFPKAYPKYKARTKMLVPLIF